MRLCSHEYLEEAEYGHAQGDWHCTFCNWKFLAKEEYKHRVFAVRNYAQDAPKPVLCGLVGIDLDKKDKEGVDLEMCAKS